MPPSGTVVYDDAGVNKMTSSVWSNCYRVLETDLLGATRPIMKNICTITPTTLGPGHYWLDWQMGGTGTSGPWANPIATLGQMTTGDARQYVPSTTSWQAVRDTGSTSSLGLPFLLNGTLIAGIDNPGNTSELSVYPNPAKDFVRVNSTSVLIDRVSMMNTLGQLVFDANPGVSNYEISLSTYERGLYTITVETEKGIKNYKVILD
jgi:hypothetical protein